LEADKKNKEIEAFKKKLADIEAKRDKTIQEKKEVLNKQLG
jgi:tetrahydromethanopterin S-methyltransferase subunit G